MNNAVKGRAGPLGPPAAQPVRGKLPHGIPPWVKAKAVFFLTLCCAPRGPNQLCHDDVAAAVWDSIDFRQRRGDWSVQLCLLMPDHLHALVRFSNQLDYVKVIANWKEMLAKRTKVCWQRDFFDHRLRSPQSAAEKELYIRQNPVRRGLVRDAADWRYVWPSIHGGPSGPALPARSC
jgi:putative transposase